MQYLETPPKLISTQSYSTMPDEFRRRQPTEWADANRPGASTDCFIEGPSFDADGNLYIVDVPFGRIFRISPDCKWSLVAEYDGWPNGLKIARDGRILVADYRHGIMELDARVGRMEKVLASRNSESFRGCNDLHLAGNGDIYFTDQGQTGLHDPTGRVYRLAASGKLDCLISTGVSPNGLVLDSAEAVLFVAHVSLGHVFVFAPSGELIARIKSCAGNACTNVAIRGDRLYITESATGTVLVADIGVLDR